MTPGSPDATTTIDGRYLPPPPAPFQGEINLNALQSKPAWPARVVPPKGAPNILLIITDDVGFSAPSTFGGVIPTPTLDQDRGKRAALHEFPHHVAVLADARRPHHRPQPPLGGLWRRSRSRPPDTPATTASLPKDTATIGRILLENGYRTSWFGKDHNTPTYQTSQAGPFDQWPTGMGFEYFYGFIGGDSSQWTPMLFRNTTLIAPFAGTSGVEPDHRHGR